MIDEQGHLIHIDFGFIFDWSPGKDMRFESANFKFTQEFIDIMGGDNKAEAYKLFVTQAVRGFLAVRQYAEEFIYITELMYHSGFPCFKPQSLDNLRYRFRTEMSNFDAARFFKIAVIDDAHSKWTTIVYDWI